MKIKDTSLFTIMLAIVIFMTVSMIGCENVTNVTQVLEQSNSQIDDVEEQLSIGLVLPLSGRLETTFGIHIKQALELGLNEINDTHFAGVNIEFVIEDDRSTIDGANDAFNKLIHEHKVSIILGPTTSSASKVTFPIAHENQTVVISPTSAARGLSAISDYAFRVALTTDVLIPNGIEATHARLGYQNVATLYDENDVFSTDGDAAVQEALDAINVNVAITETFQGGDTDFTDQLTRIMEQNPDAIFVSSLPQEKTAILLKGKELGITAPFIIRTLTEADVVGAGEAAEGAITFVGWGAAVDTPINKKFIQNYSNTYGMNPNNYAARSYGAIHILAQAIRNAKSTNAADIRDALASIKNFDTVLGKFSFDENGDAIYDPKILIVKNGKLEIFK